MPHTRQQRAPRNRRVASAATPARTAQLAMSPISWTAQTLTLSGRTLPQPPIDTPDVLPMIVNGIPQIWRVDTSNYPDSFSMNGDQTELTLHYPSAGITAGDVFIIGPQDPTVRTAGGGFMAPIRLELPSPDPALLDYTATESTGAAHIVFNAVPVGLRLLVNPFLFLQLNTQAFPISVTTTDPTIFDVTWAAPMSPGDTMAYSELPISGNGDSFVQPVTSVHTL